MSQRDEMERVKNQIRALSQKTVSNGCTEEEAQYAMEKVGELLDRYNLSMNEVMLSEHDCVTKEWRIGRKTRSAFDTVIPEISTFCDCLAYFNKLWIEEDKEIEGHYMFFGLEPDVQMAFYLCDIVDAALKTETEKFKQTNKEYLSGLYSRRSLTANFQAGFSDRMRDRFVDLNRQRRNERMQNQEAIAEGTSTDIVRLKQEKVKSEAKEKLGWVPGTRKRQSSSIRSYSAFNQGREAANNVNLNRPLSGGSRPKGQLPC